MKISDLVHYRQDYIDGIHVEFPAKLTWYKLSLTQSVYVTSVRNEIKPTTFM